MDTLFTTFLLPATGMVPPSPQPCTAIIEKCFVELDSFTSSSSNNCSKKDQFNNVDFRDYYFAMHLSANKGRGCGDWCDQENQEMCFAANLEVEFPSRCQSSPSCGYNKNQLPNSLLNRYFGHRLHHMAVDRRMHTSLQTSKCCLLFGMFGCSQVEEHCCCSKMENCKTMFKENINVESSCPCEKREQGDWYCNRHDLVIQDMEVTNRSCTWTIYFSVDDAEEGRDDPDQCFVNPCYEDASENLLDDTFEIEFTNDIQSFDSFALTANVHFACNTFDDDDDDDDDELFDFFEFDADHNYSNLIYGSSDDEEDCDEIFNSGLVISSSSSTWSANIEMRKTTKKSFHFENNTFSRENRISKYHRKCTHSSNVDDDNNNRKASGCDRLKRKVHFPKPDKLVTVHPLISWAHAYRQSRKSIWFRVAQDRTHFRRRIMNITEILDPVLKQKHSRFLLENRR